MLNERLGGYLMERIPLYKTSKYHYDSAEYEAEEDDCTENDESCPTDPDLLLLRQNAKGEREAIAFYLRAASLTTGTLSQLFLDTARDEMMHFRNSMILLAKYDPPQAQAFEDVGIKLPDELRKNQSSNTCTQDRLESIDLLTKAIVDELAAINMYQESYEKAYHDDVKALFCNNANDEKVHVAEFWKAIMGFTKENVTMP
jgi:rubrerythrin